VVDAANDPGLRAALGSAGQGRARREFSVEQMCERSVSLIARLLAARA